MFMLLSSKLRMPIASLTGAKSQKPLPATTATKTITTTTLANTDTYRLNTGWS
jgi:hypothetical protein